MKTRKKLRAGVAKFLNRSGRFISSLSVMVMKDEDLVSFSFDKYSAEEQVNRWASDEFLDKGLFEEEEELLDVIPDIGKKALVLCSGGGREVIPLAKLGYEVTGMDFIPEMVEVSLQKAKERGVEFTGVVSDIASLDLQEKSFDLSWMSCAMYSCMPGRKRRVNTLKKIWEHMAPGGYLILQFNMSKVHHYSARMEKLRKLIATLTFGNKSYEPGDVLWGHVEFCHLFASEAELVDEFKEAGFDLISFQTRDDMVRGGAVLRKSI